MNAFIFSGQGCQKEGMGKDLYAKSNQAKELFEYANKIIGCSFTDLMFNSDETFLMDTRNTQMAVFIYEVVMAMSQNDITPNCMAGHSLGEYSSLVVAGSISFEDGIYLIKKRGEILHDAFENNPGAMGAVIGLNDELVEEIIDEIGKQNQEKIYVANYNGPGQLVISGTKKGVINACKRFKELGAKRAMLLPMKASGHCPNAQKEADLLEKCILDIDIKTPFCPIYQCADGMPHTDVETIRHNLIKHLTNPVQWTRITNEMVASGVTDFYEVGTDDTLQKIVSRMYPQLHVSSLWSIPTYKNINPYNI